MATRIQVVLDEAEREAFRRQAELEGLSLSAWLRQAGREKLHAHRPSAITTEAELRAFFEACDQREQGREPDWEEHLAVMERSRTAGAAET
jgi:hypothetical protein